jgi:glutaredoxin
MGMLKIEVITAPGCGRCARTKELLARVIRDYEGVELEEVSVTEVAEVVKLGIMTTPAVVMNGNMEFRAHPEEEDLRRRIEGYLRE